MPFRRKPRPPKKNFNPAEVSSNNTETAARKTNIFRRLHRKFLKIIK